MLSKSGTRRGEKINILRAWINSYLMNFTQIIGGITRHVLRLLAPNRFNPLVQALVGGMGWCKKTSWLLHTNSRICSIMVLLRVWGRIEIGIALKKINLWICAFACFKLVPAEQSEWTFQLQNTQSGGEGKKRCFHLNIKIKSLSHNCIMKSVKMRYLWRWNLFVCDEISLTRRSLHWL